MAYNDDDLHDNICADTTPACDDDAISPTNKKDCFKNSKWEEPFSAQYQVTAWCSRIQEAFTTQAKTAAACFCCFRLPFAISWFSFYWRLLYVLCALAFLSGYDLDAFCRYLLLWALAVHVNVLMVYLFCCKHQHALDAHLSSIYLFLCMLYFNPPSMHSKWEEPFSAKYQVMAWCSRIQEAFTTQAKTAAACFCCFRLPFAISWFSFYWRLLYVLCALAFLSGYDLDAFCRYLLLWALAVHVNVLMVYLFCCKHQHALDAHLSSIYLFLCMLYFNQPSMQSTFISCAQRKLCLFQDKCFNFAGFPYMLRDPVPLLKSFQLLCHERVNAYVLHDALVHIHVLCVQYSSITYLLWLFVWILHGCLFTDTSANWQQLIETFASQWKFHMLVVCCLHECDRYLVNFYRKCFRRNSILRTLLHKRLVWPNLGTRQGGNTRAPEVPSHNSSMKDVQASGHFLFPGYEFHMTDSPFRPFLIALRPCISGVRNVQNWCRSTQEAFITQATTYWRLLYLLCGLAFMCGCTLDCNLHMLCWLYAFEYLLTTSTSRCIFAISSVLLLFKRLINSAMFSGKAPVTCVACTVRGLGGDIVNTDNHAEDHDLVQTPLEVDANIETPGAPDATHDNSISSDGHQPNSSTCGSECSCAQPGVSETAREVPGVQNNPTDHIDSEQECIRIVHLQYAAILGNQLHMKRRMRQPTRLNALLKCVFFLSTVLLCVHTINMQFGLQTFIDIQQPANPTVDMVFLEVVHTSNTHYENMPCMSEGSMLNAKQQMWKTRSSVIFPIQQPDIHTQMSAQQHAIHQYANLSTDLESDALLLSLLQTSMLLLDSNIFFYVNAHIYTIYRLSAYLEMQHFLQTVQAPFMVTESAIAHPVHMVFMSRTIADHSRDIYHPPWQNISIVRLMTGSFSDAKNTSDSLTFEKGLRYHLVDTYTNCSTHFFAQAVHTDFNLFKCQFKHCWQLALFICFILLSVQVLPIKQNGTIC